MEDKWRIWDKEIEIDEDIFDEIEEAEEEEEELTKELLEEISPDPIYFIDDDIGDVYSNIEYFEKGYANDDENYVIDDEDNPEETKEKIEEAIKKFLER